MDKSKITVTIPIEEYERLKKIDSDTDTIFFQTDADIYFYNQNETFITGRKEIIDAIKKVVSDELDEYYIKNKMEIDNIRAANENTEIPILTQFANWFK